jgi:hypothetical protein
MTEPQAGDRIRHKGVEGVVVFNQSIPGMVHVGRAVVPLGRRYVVVQPDGLPDALPDEITIYEDEWPQVEILETAQQE